MRTAGASEPVGSAGGCWPTRSPPKLPDVGPIPERDLERHLDVEVPRLGDDAEPDAPGDLREIGAADLDVDLPSGPLDGEREPRAGRVRRDEVGHVAGQAHGLIVDGRDGVAALEHGSRG